MSGCVFLFSCQKRQHLFIFAKWNFPVMAALNAIKTGLTDFQALHAWPAGNMKVLVIIMFCSAQYGVEHNAIVHNLFSRSYMIYCVVCFLSSSF